MICTFIKSLLVNHTFIFLGYSLNDNNLNLIIGWINYFRELHGVKERPANFWIDSKPAAPFEEARLESRNICVVDLSSLPADLEGKAAVPPSITNGTGRKLFTFLRCITNSKITYQHIPLEDRIIEKYQLLKSYSKISHHDLIAVHPLGRTKFLDTELIFYDRPWYECIQKLLSDSHPVVCDVYRRAGISAIHFILIHLTSYKFIVILESLQSCSLSDSNSTRLCRRWMNVTQTMEFEKIIETYANTNSTKKAAAHLNISEVKVRRVLITCGLWRSKTSDQIGDLYREGLSVKQIVEQLYMSEKNVQAYLPYSRGTYGNDNRTSDAIRSEECRLRCKTSHANQVVHVSPIKTDPASDINDKERVKTMDTFVNVLKLRLKLDLDNPSLESRYILQKYGKVKSGISRDVLVPDTMTLHALHYVIQKAFGWQNSHLHHFSLPEDVFELCTNGMFAQWGSLCGVYFRFPSDDYEDLYWDDYYEGRFSFNTWLKQKYCGPYRYDGFSERYDECQLALEDFYRRHKTIEIRFPRDFWNDSSEPSTKRSLSPKEAVLDDVFHSIAFESGANSLLERLTLKELLCPDNEIPLLIDSRTTVATPITNHLIYEYDYGDGWTVHISLIQDTEATEEQITQVKALKPICVARDGINVLDDVGGIHGFCDFLLELHEGTPEQKDELRQWSKIFNWTGRFTRPENIL